MNRRDGDKRSADATSWLRQAFIHLGILPLLLVAAILLFAIQEERFYSSLNIFNVVRQTTFLLIVALGQMIVILTKGLDMSMGAVVGFSGVVGALAMKAVLGVAPDALLLGGIVAVLAGISAGALAGAFNGIGVSYLNVPPFMMTLGTWTSLVGVSLLLTKGMPLTGVPDEFMRALGYGRIFGLAPPVLVTIILVVLVYALLNRTTIGRYFYAIGSNLRAAKLSGINASGQMFFAYVLSGTFAGVAGVLFIARTGSAEALNGSAYTLQAIAACVIGGVSLFGGIGKVRDVLLGAFFITILTNGMNLIRVESYIQSIVLGLVLILSLVADQFRMKLLK